MPRGKYGRLAPRPEVRARLLRLAAYTGPDLPPPPSECDWTKPVSEWIDWWNQELGDCTCEMAGHVLMCLSANAGAAMVPRKLAILQPYIDVGGYNPATGQPDDGLVMTDLLDYWGKVGIASNKIKGYVRLNPANQEQIQQAIYLFGNACLGINMTGTAERQFDRGQPWTVPWFPAPNVGGHAIPALSYTADGLGVITWGAKQGMSWGFLREYCDEAYSVLDLAWLNARGQSPTGLALDQLVSDLGKLPMVA